MWSCPACCCMYGTSSLPACHHNGYTSKYTMTFITPLQQHAAHRWSDQDERLGEKKRKDYAFRRQFNEKPSIIPGCPGRAAGTHGDILQHWCFVPNGQYATSQPARYLREDSIPCKTMIEPSGAASRSEHMPSKSRPTVSGSKYLHVQCMHAHHYTLHCHHYTMHGHSTTEITGNIVTR